MLGNVFTRKMGWNKRDRELGNANHSNYSIFIHHIQGLFFHSDINVTKVTLTRSMSCLLETIYIHMMLNAEFQYLYSDTRSLLSTMGIILSVETYKCCENYSLGTTLMYPYNYPCSPGCCDSTRCTEVNNIT